MINVSGTIQIKKFNGARGEFSVGNLVTSIGTFKVKENILDQYDIGRYTGEFTVSQIYPSSYAWRGKVITELRMVVTDLMLYEAGEAPGVPRIDAEIPAAANDMPEPDPIDEQLPVPVPVPAPASMPTRPASSSASAANDDDANLFGLLHDYVVQGKVKLDTTIDREIFRAQKERLKVLGFRFHSPTQTWERRAA